MQVTITNCHITIKEAAIEKTSFFNNPQTRCEKTSTIAASMKKPQDIVVDVLINALNGASLCP